MTAYSLFYCVFGHILRRFVQFGFALFRITSYNVCYTKLLRILINAEATQGKGNFTIDREKALQYHTDLKKLGKDMKVDAPEDWLSLVLKMPDVVMPSADRIEYFRALLVKAASPDGK